MKLIDKNAYGIVKKENLLSFISDEKFYEFHIDRIFEISEEKYLINKYGIKNKYWKEIFYDSVKFKNGEFLTVFYQEGIVRHHFENGKIKKEISSIHSPLGCGTYGLTLDKNEDLWIAVPSEHYVGKFNLKSGSEIFSIVGTSNMEPTIFNHPENIISIENKVYICDMGNERIVIIDIITHEILGVLKVEEPIYYFNKDIDRFYYVFTSGFYYQEIKSNEKNAYH